MNREIHRIIILLIAVFVLIRLVLYSLDDSTQQLSVTYDVILYTTFFLLLTLGPLYKYHLIYLYLISVSIIYFSYVASGIYDVINDGSPSVIANTFLPFVITSLVAYHFYYKVPALVLIKRNKALYAIAIKLKNRMRRCPDCNADLTNEFLKIDDRIEDGFICTHCNTKIGFNRTYSTIGLTAFWLWGLAVLLMFSCTFSSMLNYTLLETICNNYSDMFYIAQPVFLTIFIISLNIKNMYIMEN